MDKFGVKIADGLNIVTSHGGVNQTKIAQFPRESAEGVSC